MQRMIRSLVLALALLVLAAGAVQARPLAVRSAPVGFLDGIWQWVLAHVPSWAKSGSSLDPDGAFQSVPAPLPTSDAGGDMDPNGKQ